MFMFVLKNLARQGLIKEFTCKIAHVDRDVIR